MPEMTEELMTEELQRAVIEAMKREGIEGPYSVKRARTLRCVRDDRHPYRFRGAKNGESWVGYICVKCRVLKMWSIGCAEKTAVTVQL